MIFSENRFALFGITLMPREEPAPGLSRPGSRFAEKIWLNQKIAAVRAKSQRRRVNRGGEG
jgi:hypothetical protein